ncbi:MAG: SoxR reducing system RseC family protein [Methylobacter sp.]|nr:SoxR reducing system RseC family protein [Methylobacter sp.]
MKIANHQVWVESAQNSVCGACLQKASCTTSAIGSVLKKKSVPVDCDIPLNIGDKVTVAIDENLLLRASLLLYLLPLIALFAGAGIADWLLPVDANAADLWLAGSAILSFLASLWLINKVQSLLIMGYARPVVVRKI